MSENDAGGVRGRRCVNPAGFRGFAHPMSNVLLRHGPQQHLEHRFERLIIHILHQFSLIFREGALTLTKIKDVFAIMKNLVLENFQKSRSQVESPRGGGGPIGGESEQLQQQVKDMKSLLLQRDNELAILVNMVKKGKTADDVISGSSSSGRMQQQDNSNMDAKAGAATQQGKQSMSLSQLSKTQQQQQQLERQEKVVKRHLFGVPPPTDKNVFDDGAGQFIHF